jgi:hypothetical protein
MTLKITSFVTEDTLPRDVPAIAKEIEDALKPDAATYTISEIGAVVIEVAAGKKDEVFAVLNDHPAIRNDMHSVHPPQKPEAGQ